MMEFFRKKETIGLMPEKFDEFKDREEKLIERAGGFLMTLVPDRFKKEATAMLAAFSIFASASSAFAESSESKAKENLTPENMIESVAKSSKADEIAPFNWKKVADKIEISIGGKSEETPEFKGEIIENYYSIEKTEFYKGFSAAENNEAMMAFQESIFNSHDVKDFFKFLDTQKENLDDRQKALFLQRLGEMIGKTYNFDMLKNEEYVEVSDGVMFNAIRELFTTGKIERTGICGNIHTFLTRTAQSLGMEAWLQSGYQDGPTKLSRGNHVFSGLVVEVNGKKQIVFLNYDSLLPTGTLNYKDAIGIWERQNKHIATFNSYVGSDKEILFPVESRAQEIVSKAAGFEETSERLEAELAEGKVKKEKGLEINLSPEVKEIKLNKDYFALAYFNYQDFYNNPYQSLEDLNALRGRLNLKGERLGLELDTTYVNMNIKDLYKGSNSQEEFIARLAADYIDNYKLTKGEYGQFALNFGATLQAGIRFPIDCETNAGGGYMGEGGAGMRLIYVNPAETGKFYIGAQDVFRGQSNDFQNNDLIIEKAAETLTVGAEVKVNEAQILNFEAARSELDWGEKFKIKGGFVGEKWKVEVGHEEAISDFERFVPSSEKISAEIGYKGGPKWEINVLGFKETEKYKDAKSADKYGTEVKIRMFLW